MRLAFLALALVGCASTPPPPTPGPPTGMHVTGWSAPTQNTDGSAIVGPLTYAVYIGVCGAEKRYAITNALTFNVPANMVGCAYVTAINSAGVESSPSNEAMLP